MVTSNFLGICVKGTYKVAGVHVELWNSTECNFKRFLIVSMKNLLFSIGSHIAANWGLLDLFLIEALILIFVTTRVLFT